MSQTVTPMMAQFLEIKAEYPTALLFYRMGDFYELFFDDAVAAAEALDIALTKRGKHDGADIPMCGVPVHSAEGYLLTLIRKGFRVAVCEQLEDPKEAKKRGSKSVVKRGVVRLVTPGTLTEDTLLNPRQSNFLAAYATIRDQGCLAWVDISTGDVTYMVCPPIRLGPELARLSPSEVLVADTAPEHITATVSASGTAKTEVFQSLFRSSEAPERLKAAYPNWNSDGLDRVAASALGALIEYLHQTQKGQLPLLRTPDVAEVEAFVSIDAATRKSLELTQTLGGQRKGSLLHTVDRTVTAVGARLLAQRVTTPARRFDIVQGRLDSVHHFFDDAATRDAARILLKQTPDMERALSRLALGRGGPRDMSALGQAVGQAQAIHDLIFGSDVPRILTDACENLKGFEELANLLADALVAEPPLLARDGGFVAGGYAPDLDDLRKLRDEARTVIAGMQADYAKQTEISTLKIKHNNVLGYFIETTALHAEKMMSAPLSDTFIHRQTTANQVRFTTVELSEIETKILNAAGQAQALELQIFDDLRGQVLAQAARLQNCARALAEIDVAAAWAHQAALADWVAPTLSSAREFVVKGGRHPVVEHVLRADAAQFVANDCDMTPDDTSIWLITGPNMAGKSTYLRQNALIALLAQAGSFVPAKSAKIGLVSQIFSRVGASDDLASGRSTFMVEMVETAAILNHADDRALVILDEIGRGTSTYDGLSIAWATLEHLHNVNGCRALFATHYHEMTQVSDALDHAGNATVAVKEYDGQVVFLHEVRPGKADRSYGVQVAKLAGLPDVVLTRAKVVLDALEKSEREGGSQKAIIDDLPLFSAVAPAPPSKDSKVDAKLKTVNPDELTPKEALDLVYALKALE
ncbi:MAG: DNA mismatch repair protein MutS [Pseudomonadota bacterium]